jgi:hypothetical protein
MSKGNAALISPTLNRQTEELILAIDGKWKGRKEGRNYLYVT